VRLSGRSVFELNGTAVWQNLSARAQQYFNAAAVGDPKAYEEGAIEISGELASLINPINRRYAGQSFRIMGGQMAGRLTLGARRSAPPWRLDDRLLVVPIAKHETAQCTFVLASDGRFGSSWNRDFRPLFDSLDLMFEDVAVWGSLQGWHYVGYAREADPATFAADVSGLIPDETASGALSGWWLGDGIAMSFRRFLTHDETRPPYIELLANSAQRARHVADLLAGQLTSTWLLDRGDTVPFLQG